ncbi:MAG: hypothetical protein JSS34_06990 [Proteobacteria bacterium]|nr:hypothetical protein [Pseudomonadota bacterium]
MEAAENKHEIHTQYGISLKENASALTQGWTRFGLSEAPAAYRPIRG